MKRFPIHINPHPVYLTRYHKYNTKLTSHFTPENRARDQKPGQFRASLSSCRRSEKELRRLFVRRWALTRQTRHAPIAPNVRTNIGTATENAPRTTRRSRKANNHAPRPIPTALPAPDKVARTSNVRNRADVRADTGTAAGNAPRAAHNAPQPQGEQSRAAPVATRHAPILCPMNAHGTRRARSRRHYPRPTRWQPSGGQTYARTLPLTAGTRLIFATLVKTVFLKLSIPPMI